MRAGWPEDDGICANRKPKEENMFHQVVLTASGQPLRLDLDSRFASDCFLFTTLWTLTLALFLDRRMGMKRPVFGIVASIMLTLWISLTAFAATSFQVDWLKWFEIQTLGIWLGLLMSRVILRLRTTSERRRAKH